MFRQIQTFNKNILHIHVIYENSEVNSLQVPSRVVVQIFLPWSVRLCLGFRAEVAPIP